MITISNPQFPPQAPIKNYSELALTSLMIQGTQLVAQFTPFDSQINEVVPYALPVLTIQIPDLWSDNARSKVFTGALETIVKYLLKNMSAAKTVPVENQNLIID